MSQPHWHNCTATAAMAQTNAIAKRKAADVYRLYQAAHAIQMPTKVAAAEPTTNYNAAVTHCLRCEYTKTTLCTTRSPAGAKGVAREATTRSQREKPAYSTGMPPHLMRVTTTDYSSH